MRKRYLFIRILESCNANCFMCDFALSLDGYRFTVAEFESVLTQAVELGVGFVRFTGGEPLLHTDILAFIRTGVAAGMGMSLITNGFLLPRMIADLAQAGLTQVIVSIDGATAETHEDYRQRPGLFAKGIAGLKQARQLGLRTRVNTVIGPYNYHEMPALQQLLTDLKVDQWELSAIKLERPILYSNPDHVRAICDPIYEPGHNLLIPMGKRFYGNTEVERQHFFETGVTPRAGLPQCHLVGDVIYIDAKDGRGYGCSLLPHRNKKESGGGVVMRYDGHWRLASADFDNHISHFRTIGSKVCCGCSTTAAGYSDDVAANSYIPDWHF